MNARVTIIAKRVALAALVLFLGVGGPGSASLVAEVSEPTVVASGAGALTIAWPRHEGAERVEVWLSPEPPGPDGRLVAASRVATLDGAAESAVLGDLPPDTDLFLRVVSLGGDGEHRADLHARTPRGSRTELALHLREVAMIAPNVMRVVVAGRPGDGARLSGTGWQVRRRDGSAIAVRRVHRHSVPIAQPDYEVAFAGHDDIETVVVEHRMYLVMGEAVGSPEVVRVEGPAAIRFTLPFSDRWLETPVVQLNQVGYDPDARVRWAYVSAWMGDGGGLSLERFPGRAEVLRSDDRRRTVVDDLRIRPRAAMDSDTGAPVAEIDLSRLPADEEAEYRVRIAGVGVSHPTRVSGAAVRDAYRTVARGIYHQRWGIALSAEHTRHPRPMAHGFAYTSDREDAMSFHPRGTPKRGRRQVLGGYHDAGDFDQRPMHTVVPELLMRAYELHPGAFRDGDLDIPESGNGVPDLLDEAMWGVLGWEALQEQDGGVRAGIESTRHPPGVYGADQDELDYFTYARDPQVTARAAGLFAQAARLIRPYDGERARSLTRSAERAWQWAERREVRDPYALYALGELFRATGEARYGRAFEQRWRRIGPYGAFSNFATRHNRTGDYVRGGQVMPDYVLGYLLADGADPAILQTARRWLTQQADEVAGKVLDSPRAHRSPRGELRPDWGDGTVMGRHLDPIVARLALGPVDPAREQRYLDALSVGADYVLGANPLGMVFVTGLGSRHPEEPTHLDSLAHVARGAGPVPGIPVYGPVAELPRAPYYRHAAQAFHPAFEQHPLMLRYADVRTFVNTNECTVWECQAPHTLHLSILAAR